MANDAYIDTSEDNGNPFEGFYELSEYEQWLSNKDAQNEYKSWLDKKDSENVKQRASRGYISETETPF